MIRPATDVILPAVAYYRMSSDKQETSIRDQQKAVEKYAADNGYTIAAEYSDEGIAGWKSEQREAFQRLITDAANGTFRAILCWDQDRFSRFPVLEANHYWYLLDRAGVHIATVNQGRLDFTDLGSWLKASVTQHGKSEYCRDLSNNCTRGLREVKLTGKWTGSAPYGYAIGDDMFLKIGDPAQVEVVQRIFRWRVEGTGYWTMAKRLNAAGVPAPRAAAWNQKTIQDILVRPCYIGSVQIGKFARGKYNRVVKEPTIIKNVHPPIIDQVTWDTCQRMRLYKGKAHTRGDREGAPLAGLLFCGRCGGPMYSIRFHDQWAYYKCSNHQKSGTCGHCIIDQKKALAAIGAKLREHILMGSIERLEAAVEREIKRRAVKAPAVNEAAVRRQLAGIDRKIENATDRMLTVDKSLVPAIESRLLALYRQKAELSAELVAPPHVSRQRDAKAIAAQVWMLDEVLANGSPSKVRSALRKIIQRITLQFDEAPSTPKRRRFQFVRGKIELFSKAATPSGTSWR